MKLFVALVAIVAVAVASPIKPIRINAELQAILDAIHSPSTDPATAALLLKHLQEILVALNVIDPIQEPIFGPEIIDFPLPDGGDVAEPIVPSPVIVGPVAPGQPAPLVQIIVNVNQPGADAAIIPQPVIVDESDEVKPDPVIIVEEAEQGPIVPEPVIVAPINPIPIVPEPVIVAPINPTPVAPVIIGTPIIPSPAVTLPEELN